MERTKNFNFQGRNYSVSFPTVGQYMDIESEKIVISKNQWSNLVFQKTLSSFRAMQIIECIATLKILCPDIFKDMKVDNYRNIDAKDFLELLNVYNKEISPWYGEWFEEFNSVIDNINKDSDELEKKEQELDKEEKK